MTKRGKFTTLAACLLSMSAWAADDAQIGNWRLDLARSRFVRATAPKSSIAMVTAYGKDGSGSNALSTWPANQSARKYG